MEQSPLPAVECGPESPSKAGGRAKVWVSTGLIWLKENPLPSDTCPASSDSHFGWGTG